MKTLLIGAGLASYGSIAVAQDAADRIWTGGTMLTMNEAAIAEHGATDTRPVPIHGQFLRLDQIEVVETIKQGQTNRRSRIRRYGNGHGCGGQFGLCAADLGPTTLSSITMGPWGLHPWLAPRRDAK